MFESVEEVSLGGSASVIEVIDRGRSADVAEVDLVKVLSNEVWASGRTEQL